MPPKKKAANGYKFAEPLPKGTVLEDIGRNKWKLGPSIGKGGFGEIYSAKEESSKSEVYPYVIKIEPHANGPLFVEINFYVRHAKAAYIEEFKKEKGLKSFGMPVYHASGSLEYKNEKYRFLVMDKFSTDLYKLYIENNKVFPVDTVFKLGIQILDVLEYIHERGYVHADIKAANILLGATKETEKKQVYVVDFGLASKYTMEKEFKPNPKKAHDGTIEFLSRDAHQGVQTRRGDIEILAYNLIQWLGCTLPWEGNLTDPKVVQNSKEENMTTVPKMIKASFGSKTPPKAIVDFLKYLKTLKFNTEPDYKKIKVIFTAGVKSGGGSIDSPLLFSKSTTPLKRNRTPRENSNSKKTKETKEDADSEISGDEEETPKPKKRAKTKKAAVVASEELDVEMESTNNNDEKKDISFVTTRRPKLNSADNKLNRKKSKSLQDLSNNINFDGYNDAMKEVILKKDEAISKRTRTRRQNNNSKSAEVTKEEEHGEIKDDEEETSKPKRKGRQNKKLVVITEENNEKATETTKSDEDTPTSSRSKRANAGLAKPLQKKALRLSRSVDDLTSACNLEGYTDAMKEIMLKKQKIGVRKGRGNTQKPESSTIPDDMTGFTEEMKAIALKKKAKEKTGKKNTAAIPIATTSKASDKRGIVKPNSKRLPKKGPVAHGEVISYSEGSVSE